LFGDTRKPHNGDEANPTGVVYVTARMDWYCELLRLLLKENTVDGGTSAGLRSKLEDHVVDLYKALLLYLMKSVCSYNRNRILSFFRDTVKRDGWDSNLMAIREAERAVQQDSAEYNTQQIRSHLEQLVEVAKKPGDETSSGHLSGSSGSGLTAEGAANRG
jgi:hypothetical protein